MSVRLLVSDGGHSGQACGAHKSGENPNPKCPGFFAAGTLDACKEVCLASEQPNVCMGFTWQASSNRCTTYTMIDLTSPVSKSPGIDMYLVEGRRVPTEIDYEAASNDEENEEVDETLEGANVPVKFTMATDFPNSGQVEMRLDWEDASVKTVKMNVRVRMPSWLLTALAVKLGGKVIGTGTPGSYLHLDRTWSRRDVLTLTLPTVYHFSNYIGLDQIAGREGKRYAVSVGPVVLACVGPINADDTTVLPVAPSHPTKWLIPTETPLHFNIAGVSNFVFKPLWSVDVGEKFAVYPIFAGTDDVLV